MSKANMTLSRRWIEEGLNKGNVDLMDELFEAKCVYHGPFGETVRGRKAMKQMVAAWLTAFPGAHCTIDDMVSAGDKVIGHFAFTGTHRGEFLGVAPTGKRVKVKGIVMSRFSGGKLVEDWEFFDTLGLFQQLGAVPPVGQSKEQTAG